MVTPGFIWNACVPPFAKPRREAADRSLPTENPEEGSGTVLAVGIIAALLILATVIIGFAGVSTANRRAAQAADLAALAAADALRGITPGDPCDIAAQVARDNNANLVGCALADRPETVDIRVSSAVHGPFAFLGDAQVHRAPGHRIRTLGRVHPMRDYPAMRSPKAPPPTEPLKNRGTHKIRLMSPKGVLARPCGML